MELAGSLTKLKFTKLLFWFTVPTDGTGLLRWGIFTTHNCRLIFVPDICIVFVPTVTFFLFYQTPNGSLLVVLMW